MERLNLSRLKQLTIYLLCLSFILCLFSCGSDDNTPIQIPLQIPFNIKYSVTSWDSLSADITYCYRGEEYFDNNAKLPWHDEFIASPNEHLYLEISNVCGYTSWGSLLGTHSITIGIYKNDNLLISAGCYEKFDDPNTFNNCDNISIEATI